VNTYKVGPVVVLLSHFISNAISQSCFQDSGIVNMPRLKMDRKKRFISKNESSGIAEDISQTIIQRSGDDSSKTVNSKSATSLSSTLNKNPQKNYSVENKAVASTVDCINTGPLHHSQQALYHSQSQRNIPLPPPVSNEVFQTQQKSTPSCYTSSCSSVVIEPPQPPPSLITTPTSNPTTAPQADRSSSRRHSDSSLKTSKHQNNELANIDNSFLRTACVQNIVEDSMTPEERQLLGIDGLSLIEHTTGLEDAVEDRLFNLSCEITTEIVGLPTASRRVNTLLAFFDNVLSGEVTLHGLQKKSFQIWLYFIRHCLPGEGYGPIYNEEVQAKAEELLNRVVF
jgi:hypothetical protein